MIPIITTENEIHYVRITTQKVIKHEIVNETRNSTKTMLFYLFILLIYHLFFIHKFFVWLIHISYRSKYVWTIFVFFLPVLWWWWCSKKGVIYEKLDLLDQKLKDIIWWGQTRSRSMENYKIWSWNLKNVRQHKIVLNNEKWHRPVTLKWKKIKIIRY